MRLIIDVAQQIAKQQPQPVSTKNMNTPNQTAPAPTNMIPPGVYHAMPLRETWAEVVEKSKNSSEDASDQCGITLRILDEGPFKGREYVWYGSYKDGEAVAITMRTLTEMGIAFNDEGVPSLDNMVADVRIGIVHKPQQKRENGQLVNVLDPATNLPKVIPQINWISSGPAQAKAVTDEGQIAAHRARMKGTLAALGKKAETKPEEVPKGPDGKPLF